MQAAGVLYLWLKIIPFWSLPGQLASLTSLTPSLYLSEAALAKWRILPEVSNLILSFHSTHESTHDHSIQANLPWLAITRPLLQTRSLQSHPSWAVQSRLYEGVYGLQPPGMRGLCQLLTTFDLHLTSRQLKSPVTILFVSLGTGPPQTLPKSESGGFQQDPKQPTRFPVSAERLEGHSTANKGPWGLGGRRRL